MLSNECQGTPYAGGERQGKRGHSTFLPYAQQGLARLKYYRFISSGDSVDTWVYFQIHPVVQRMTLRDRYRGIACPKCGKFDEYAALGLGVDADVCVRTRRDFVRTAEESICVSIHFREVFEKERIQGIEFVPLSDGKFFVVRPTVIAPVDPATSGIKYIGEPCPVCGRYRESIYPPRLASMTKPEDPMVVFSPSLRTERRCQWAEIFMTEIVAEKLRKHNVRGIHWTASAKVM